jgi:hypothetical protein
MKVTATQEGFFGRLRSAGDQFEIPDQPSRKVGKVSLPLAFSDVWMRAGWDSAPIAQAPPQSHLQAPATETAIDLNADVI